MSVFIFYSRGPLAPLGRSAHGAPTPHSAPRQSPAEVPGNPRQPLAHLVKKAIPARARKHVNDGRQRAAFLIRAGVVRPVDDERLSLDVLARQKPPVSAVLGVVAVVAHGEIMPGGHRNGSVIDAR